ncbi:hypothetical protein [Micromonospora sp. IBHARD004]
MAGSARSTRRAPPPATYPDEFDRPAYRERVGSYYEESYREG